MIESTLRFDDIEVIPGLLLLLRAVQRSHMQSREWSGIRPGSVSFRKIYKGGGENDTFMIIFDFQTL